MNTDIMIDLETLATTPNAAVLTIGAVRFDPFGEDMKEPSADSFYVKIDVDSCDAIGLEVSPDTLDWWSRQDQSAQDEAFGTEGRIPISDAMNQLYKFCWGAKRVWSHGASFDIVICENVFRKLQKAVPWTYWQVRCTRTLFDIGINPERPPVLKHHALEDAWNQAVGVQNIYKRLRTASSIDGQLFNPLAQR